MKRLGVSLLPPPPHPEWDAFSPKVTPPPTFHQALSLDPNITTNQNYNKILERDWLSPARFEN